MLAKLNSQEIPEFKYLTLLCLQTVYVHYDKVFKQCDPQQFFFIFFWRVFPYVI